MTDKEYVNCKRIIKRWEKKFIEDEKRNPTKDDIKKASISVRDAYKLYWYLKTSLLEEAIIDDENVPPEKDSTDAPDSISNIENNCTQVTSRRTSSGEVGNSDISVNTSDESVQSNDDTMKLANKKSVWGDHLKKKVTSSTVKNSKTSSSCQFTEKLFKGLKLKKRNPRKSISYSEKFKSPSNLSFSVDESSEDLLQVTSCVMDAPETTQAEYDSPDIPTSVQITSGKLSNPAQPINIPSEALDFPSTLPRIMKNKIDQGWLERCDQVCDLNMLNESSSTSIPESSTVSRTFVPSSDEDYVYSSDDENSKADVSVNVKILDNSGTISSDSTTLKKTDNFLSSKEDLLETSSASKSIDPIEAAKSLIYSRSNGVSGNTKRLLTNGPFSNEKKFKMATDYDVERKQSLLDKKMASGKANENFVRIDLKHKRFARGKKGLTFSKYKKQNWKLKKKAAGSSAQSNPAGTILKCFKCGDVGHFSKQCKKKNVLLPLEEFCDTEECPFPSLEEAARMAEAKRKSNNGNSEVAEMLEMCDTFDQPNLEEDLKSVPPLCECNNEESIKDYTIHLNQTLKKFGHDAFRPGQEKVMMRILSGKSTLFISSTGSGKSLCYQLPAYLYAQRYKCVSLVISPLVSLMEDQVANFPSFLNAACIHTNQTAQQRDKIIEKVLSNKISVLLISPEAMISGEYGILGRRLMKNFPPIAFVCIDEVHCVSQWSHNFRTSYLMICKMLKERFKIRTFLGLTATATVSTINCVTEHLGILKSEIPEAVCQQIVLPKNLILSVSKDENRDNALVRLFKKPPFCEFNSIIIYCLRRNECERLASFLRTTLADFKKPIQMFGERGALSADVEVYHAGLSAARRKRVQNNFMTGKLRIVVATVAFGMGINKADIRGIIHYNMPKTFEHYVQEIGRAGRDELPARCHLFYDVRGNDLQELKRHIFADSVDRHVIRKLLQKVFQPCECIGACEKHELAFSVESTIQTLDLSQESISTLLCYLELLPERMIKVLPPTYTICTVQSFGGVKALQEAAKKCPPLAYAIAEYCKNSNSSKICNEFEFDVIALAQKINWKSGVVKNELKQCEWKKMNDSYHRSAISVTFSEVGFHVESPGSLTEVEMDYALDALHKRVMSQENTALDQLDTCSTAFTAAAYDTVEDSSTCEDLVERNETLKKQIKAYFTEEIREGSSRRAETELKDRSTVMSNIHRLVSSHRDGKFTGRAIARIFHGIESPNYPAVFWSRSPFWRCGLDEDFNAVCRFASHELVNLR